MSKKAGLQCVLQTVASRGMILPLPVVVLPAVLVGLLKRGGVMPTNPRARMWAQVRFLQFYSVSRGGVFCFSSVRGGIFLWEPKKEGFLGSMPRAPGPWPFRVQLSVMAKKAWWLPKWLSCCLTNENGSFASMVSSDPTSPFACQSFPL